LHLRNPTTAPAHRTIARASWLGFCVLVYMLVAVFIYRAWWSTLAVRASQAAEEEARAETPIKYHHYTWVGLQYYKKRDFQSAESAFRTSIKYAPDRPLAYNNLGSALNAQGRWDEAIAVLEHALSLDSNLALTRNNLAWAREERAKRGE
jgi:tetratricopeptide (TPR) repeat protein